MNATETRNVSGFRFRLGYRPSLDGLRGYAVLLVMASHLGQGVMPGGFIGVDIFFVLSGFLITALLLEEFTATGDVNFRSFYIRRALRLFPALAVVICAAGGQYYAHSFLGTGTADPTPIFRTMFAAAFYMSDWVAAFKWWDLGPLLHTWSLSVEEQFYLLWPLSLLLLLRSRLSRRGLLAVIAVGIVASVILRHLLWPNVMDYQRASYGLDVNAAALLLGAALAIIAVSGWLPHGKRTVQALRFLAPASAAGIMVFSRVGSRTMAFLQDGGYTLLALGAVAIIWLALVDQSAVLRAFLNNRAMVFLGTISYGLYLWHFLVFRTVHARVLPTEVDIPLRFAGSLAAALVSYYVIERPFLRLKSRLAPRGAASPSVAPQAEPRSGRPTAAPAGNPAA